MPIINLLMLEKMIINLSHQEIIQAIYQTKQIIKKTQIQVMFM